MYTSLSTRIYKQFVGNSMVILCMKILKTVVYACALVCACVCVCVNIDEGRKIELPARQKKSNV